MTPRQLDVLYQRWKLGSEAAAAKELNCSVSTVKNTLYLIRLRIGAVDTLQATYILRHELAKHAADNVTIRGAA